MAAQSRGFGTADGRRFVRRYFSLENRGLTPRGAGGRVQALDSIPVFLQVVATGKAQLYLLNYHLKAERNPLENTEYESTFLYLQVPGSAWLRLQESTFRAVLREQLRACPAIENAIRDTRFTAPALAQVVQAYNLACGAGFAPPAVLPLTARESEQGERFGRVGLRAGAVLGTAYYPESSYNSASRAQTNWTFGLSFQEQGKGHWGVVSGLHLTIRSNEAFVHETVPSSYLNKGTIIALRQQLSVWTAQIPLLAQYVTLPVNGKQLFAALGPVLGANFKNTTKQEVAASVFVPGQFLPALGSRELNVGADEKKRLNPTFGGQVSVGVRRRAGARTLVGELYYERGQELAGNALNGEMYYQSGGLRIGVDF